MPIQGKASAVLIVLTGAFLGASVAVFATGVQHPSAAVTQSPAPTAIRPAPAQYHPAVPITAPIAPASLQIPRLGINAPVERVGPTPALMLGVPTRVWDVAWYELGAAPGAPGDAVLVGHLDSETGGPAVFQNLAALAPGDLVLSRLANGRTVRFRVSRAFWTPYTSIPAGLLDTTGPARLSLITCAGAWDSGKKTYTQRLVVQATAIS